MLPLILACVAGLVFLLLVSWAPVAVWLRQGPPGRER